MNDQSDDELLNGAIESMTHPLESAYNRTLQENARLSALLMQIRDWAQAPIPQGQYRGDEYDQGYTAAAQTVLSILGKNEWRG